MLRPISLAARTSLAAVLALATVMPAHAQTTAEPVRPQADAAAPPAADAPAAAPPAPVVEVDPLVAQVRQQAAALARGNVIAADRTAVADFYGDRTATIWVTTDGFTPRARHAMAEIAKADDWGLEARAFDLPQLAPGETSLAALADAEVKLSLAALKYARYARGGRFDPAQLSRNFDQKPTLREPKVVMEAVAATETPGNYLRDLHPKHVQFERLRQALLKARGTGSRPEEKAETIVRVPDGPTLKLGTKHPNVVLLRQRLKLAAQPGEEDVYDRGVQDAVKEFQQQERHSTERHADQPYAIRHEWRGCAETSLRLRGPAHCREHGTVALDARGPGRLLRLGQRAGVSVARREERPDDPSDQDHRRQTRNADDAVLRQHALRRVRTRMGSAGFHQGEGDPALPAPDVGWRWSVRLGGGGTDTRVLQRHNLKVSFNGKPVDASQVDWQQVDIRRFTFIQPAGPSNVLGGIKFRFPNKHDIYMHDTPQRDLFEKTVRAYSHGCIRVQNPGRLAEILLEEDKGWSAAHVRGLLAQGGNNEVTLTKQIPVHITYFTVMVGDDGRLQSFGDLYGHDNRVASALAGRQLPLEAPSVTAASPKDFKEARRAKSYNKQTNNNDFFAGLFGN